MTLTVTVVAVIAFACLASTASVPTSRPELVDGTVSEDDYQPSGRAVESVDSYQLYQPQPLPLNIQLPKAEQNPIPFYAPEPIAYLKAPNENQEPNYYQVPLPAQELVAPVETAWNPDNDPKLYYEVPALLTKQDLPTKAHPKKYNKEVHSKDKPYSAKPKQEIVLEPINEKQYETKQKDLHKVFEQLAKQENQKQVQLEKIQQAIQV